MVTSYRPTTRCSNSNYRRPSDQYMCRAKLLAAFASFLLADPEISNLVAIRSFASRTTAGVIQLYMIITLIEFIMISLIAFDSDCTGRLFLTSFPASKDASNRRIVNCIIKLARLGWCIFLKKDTSTIDQHISIKCS